jgi:hypothetical protein
VQQCRGNHEDEQVSLITCWWRQISCQTMTNRWKESNKKSRERQTGSDEQLDIIW